jgi:hypothetical protein
MKTAVRQKLESGLMSPRFKRAARQDPNCEGSGGLNDLRVMAVAVDNSCRVAHRACHYPQIIEPLNYQARASETLVLKIQG